MNSMFIIIVISEDIFKNIKFDIWDKVDSYFNEYDIRNGFAIVKYRIE